MGFPPRPGISGYHPAWGRWQRPGCRQPGQSCHPDRHSVLPQRPRARRRAGSRVPGDVQACPKAGKKSLSHPKHGGGLAHLPQGKVRSRQAPVPWAIGSPAPKGYGVRGMGLAPCTTGGTPALPGGSSPPLAASPCRNVHTHMHPACSPTLLQPLPTPCPSALVSPSQMPAELRPVEGLCPVALGHFCPLLASLCAPRLTHPASHRQDLGWGEPLVTPRCTLLETSLQPHWAP